MDTTFWRKSHTFRGPFRESFSGLGRADLCLGTGARAENANVLRPEPSF